ncbi:hypothetical protein COCC4DRAFT_60214 [Bipolaris maydis ATCC 48331]|uniref:Uncharacterized protein n=2 Tax=Cochliobolus heterostrophus TaxID=5016 RepID=M2T040_COCH5|nr:uncharacterized protein COCC4DRAFT_60214 [Bipolaris maydis ATCC 48331]EMD90970.1 hypothetical protein COCHEDRAFT_1030735 [Bipolaris maydis C5]ENI05946.1 hypothetical protein COCC4DRAFT_60214 [Bipolaris maydis ATCC 48331]KAJ6193362.1 hypothetical protein J3E72DRAFT_272598 [Bipolaris maydis]KAJ6205234.1 hypothetical protein PSV09DRAFT_1030735 [Bipolaris maydis]
MPPTTARLQQPPTPSLVPAPRNLVCNQTRLRSSQPRTAHSLTPRPTVISILWPQALIVSPSTTGLATISFVSAISLTETRTRVTVISLAIAIAMPVYGTLLGRHGMNQTPTSLGMPSRAG